MAGIEKKVRPEDRFQYNRKEKQEEFGLSWADYGARFYDTQLGRWHSVDTLAEQFPSWSPYNFVMNNPLRYVDPDGRASDDFVKKADGSIDWDNDANDQITTKEGETYLGKTLTFTFNIYIDADLWDGPGGDGPAGDKLTSTFILTASENDAGEITDVSSKHTIKVGDTPVGTARDYYPGEGGNNNTQLLTKYTTDGKFSGFKLSFEQHASVSPMEEFGLNALGYKIVDVAQQMDVSFNKGSGNLSISASTGIFPSATLDVNSNQVMKYNQPSFVKTHDARTPVMSTYLPGQVQGYKSDYSYYPSKFYKRK